MMGLHITKPFKTFTETGFPKELIDQLEKRTGHKVIGNKSSSGTEILDELAEEEIATDKRKITHLMNQYCRFAEKRRLSDWMNCIAAVRSPVISP